MVHPREKLYVLPPLKVYSMLVAHLGLCYIMLMVIRTHSHDYTQTLSIQGPIIWQVFPRVKFTPDYLTYLVL